MALGRGSALSRAVKVGVTGAIVALSVFVQIVGAFFFPCGWYESPVRASLAPARFWDLSDVEVVRCLRAGPVRPALVDLAVERLKYGRDR